MQAFRGKNAEQLRSENEMLRQVIFARETNIPVEWKIPRGNHARLMGLLVAARGVVTVDHIMHALYWDRNPPKTDPRVHVGNLVRYLRMRLKPYGIEIRSAYARGYEMSPKGPEIVAAYLRVERRREKQKINNRVFRLGRDFTKTFSAALLSET